MAGESPKSLPAIGFLTVVEQADQGLFGGYLVLNSSGRPLEFHCTAPVKANRAQEILYGPTLAPYLVGEQIGQTLIKRAKANTLLICTDVQSALAAREFTSVPMVLVESNDEQQETVVRRLDAAHQGAAAPNFAPLNRFSLGEQRVAVLASHASDEQDAASNWSPYADGFDLSEPFTRIREAISEAQRNAR